MIAAWRQRRLARVLVAEHEPAHILRPGTRRLDIPEIAVTIARA